MCVQWRRVVSVFSEHVDQSAVVKPIHIFVLSSVIRRPVIVVGQTDCTGVYLPVVHAQTDCCRSPLVVLHVADQFVPLVPRAGHSPMEPAVPLWRADTDEPLAVRCLLDSESPQLALTSYLHVVERTHTSATSVGLFPVAKYDVIAPDINIVDQCLAPAATQSDTLPVRIVLHVVVATQLTEYPVNLGTWVFFEPGNPVLLNPVFISVYPVLLLPRN